MPPARRSRRWPGPRSGGRARVRPVAALLLGLLAALPAGPARADEPGAAIPVRGYYMTFMRMPTFGIEAWEDMLDCLEEDDANVVVLWMAGGFRSVRHPVTWGHNADHANVRDDIGRRIIDGAHARGIRVLLGFTPFAYDGVNRFALERPDLAGRTPQGTPIEEFGIHCWGRVLCPAKADCQDLMLDYVREMTEDFYPGADGLFIETSDYGGCRCPECVTGGNRREREFVRRVSADAWRRDPDATIVVYPTLFRDAEADSSFDRRWTLVFTPHSAPLAAEEPLLGRAAGAWWWNDAPSMGDPWGIRAGARIAADRGLTGFVPSLEPFSYVMPRTEFGVDLTGRRVKPLGFDWIDDGVNPLRELPARLQRSAFRAFTADPRMTDEEFRRRVGGEFFGDDATAELVDDLFALQSLVTAHRTWSAAAPVVNPEVFRQRSERERWPPDRLAAHRGDLARVRDLADRHGAATAGTRAEIGRIARFIAGRWADTPP